MIKYRDNDTSDIRSTAAQVRLPYGRDLNVREAEHALAAIDDEMAKLRAELGAQRHHHDEWVVAANIRMVDQNAEIDRLRADLNRWNLDARAHANVLLSEKNDRLIDENARLRAERDALLKELDYAYRCVSSGYDQGVFDFSILRNRSLEHMRRAAEGK